MTTCMEPLRVAAIGHSWVAKLQAMQNKSVVEVDGRPVEWCFIAKQGAKLSDFWKEEGRGYRQRMSRFRPHIIFTFIGGNDVAGPATREEVRWSADGFFKGLKREYGDEVIIIAAQAEDRFYEMGNRFGAPVGVDYVRKKESFNGYLQGLQANKFIDRIFRLGGPGGFKERGWYVDHAHLTAAGMVKLWRMMENVLQFAYRARYQDREREEDERRAAKVAEKRRKHWERQAVVGNKRGCGQNQPEGVARVRGPVRQNIRELKEVVDLEMRQNEGGVKIRDTWEERSRWMEGKKRELDAREREVEGREREVDRRETEVEKRLEDLRKKEMEMEDKKKKFVERERELNLREREVGVKEREMIVEEKERNFGGERLGYWRGKSMERYQEEVDDE